MTRAAASLITAAVVVSTAAAVPRVARAQAAPASVRLLDVPYLPQTVALCGGAAAAMVMRYWGTAGIFAESFSDLVVDDEQGIRGSDLVAALQARGWDARAFRGDTALLQQQLDAGRPLVALIEDAPGRFHYVVVVGRSNQRIVAHDPARAPFRVYDEADFVEAWSKAGSWTMLVLPGAEAAAKAPAPAVEAGPAERSDAASPCDAMIEEGVRLAGAGEPPAARRLFELAGEACPRSSAPWREMAGLHAVAERWADAAADARRAVERNSRDTHAWRILATSLYLVGEPEAALGAWNTVGEPAIDLIDIQGLGRTRFRAAMSTLALEPRDVLTPRALAAARRRLAELPAAQTTRVSFTPMADGRARVDAVVLERPLLPVSRFALASAAVRAAASHEIQVVIASPTGGGEAWTAAWRWWEHRQALSLGLMAPSPVGGIWGVRISRERETFDDGVGSTVERRLGASAALSDWTERGLRWEAAAGLDRWRDGVRAGRLQIGLEQRLADDRVSLAVRASSWFGGLRTWSAGGAAEWRSSARHEGMVGLARAGIDAAGGNAPMMLWPGADSGTARGVLLRAHPLVDGGIVRDGVLGRTLAHAGVEWRRWMQPRRLPIRVAPAVFVDVARAARTSPGFERRAQVDAGAGVRVTLPGAGVVRVDVARGLRDGAMALSVGWSR